MTTQKIALVTGGSRGLGKNMALSLAKKGIHVLLTYHRQSAEAQATVREIEALGQKSAALQLNSTDVKSFDASAVPLRKLLLPDLLGNQHSG